MLNALMPKAVESEGTLLKSKVSGSPLGQYSGTTKFRFRIRTSLGLLVDNLQIHGRDLAEAQHKLCQVYRNCVILEYSESRIPERLKKTHYSFDDIAKKLTE